MMREEECRTCKPSDVRILLCGRDIMAVVKNRDRMAAKNQGGYIGKTWSIQE